MTLSGDGEYGGGLPASAGAVPQPPPGAGPQPPSGAGPQLPPGAVALPVPPAGPGVHPPFAAPPTDGNRKRLWIGLGVGGAALLLCCVGGIGGFVALAVSSSTERINQARTVVTKYMTAWQHANYSAAYLLVCDEVKREESLIEFSANLSQRQIGSFVVERPQLATDATLVPVVLNFVDGTSETDEYGVVVDTTGNSLVCGSQ